MTPGKIAVVGGSLMALLLGLLVGVEVAKSDQPVAVTTTLTFLKRVPVTSVVHNGTTQTVVKPVTTTVTVPGANGTNTTLVRTKTVTVPPLTLTKTQTVTQTVTQTTTVTTTGP